MDEVGYASWFDDEIEAPPLEYAVEPQFRHQSFPDWNFCATA